MSKAYALGLTFALSSAGCGNSSNNNQQDAQISDAGGDAALVDAGGLFDAGGDAGTLDAGALDAGGTSDAGLFDGGMFTDAGRTFSAELDEAISQLTGKVGRVEGTGRRCTATSDNRKQGKCYGFFCGTNGNSIKAGRTKKSPCGTDAQLALICDGLGAREASRCARDHALDANPRAGTQKCLRANKKLNAFTNGCLKCFLDSADCARAHCVTECLAGDNRACDRCREKNGCTPRYYKCSGIPNPQ